MISRSSAGVVGRSLSGACRDIDLTPSQGIAYGADEDPGASDLGELTLVQITGCGDADKGGADATAPAAVATSLAWARASADVRAQPIGRVKWSVVIRSDAALGPDLR